jgi:hypothetical protein
MNNKKDQKLRPKDWLPFFEEAGVQTEELSQCKGNHSKAIKVGQFLSPKVDREVRIQVGDRTGKAVLRVELDRSKTKRYFFEVSWDAEENEKRKAFNSTKKKAKKGKSESTDTSKSRMKPKTPGKQDQTRSGGAKAGGKKSTSPRKRTGKNAAGNEENW